MIPSPTNSRVDYGLPPQVSNTPFAFDIASSSMSPQPVPRQSSGRGALTGGRHITRNRASYSCHTCRRRKVKCDKVHPVCGNCVKNGTECVYDAVPRRDTTTSSHGPDASVHGVKRRRETSRPLDGDGEGLQSPHNNARDGRNGGSQEQRNAIEARLDKLTSMIERLSRTKGPPSLEEVDRQLRAENPELESMREHRQNLLRAQAGVVDGQGMRSSAESRQASPRRNAEFSDDEFPIPSGQATDLVDPVGSLNLGHLSLEDGGKSRYVGTTYWAYISEEINELNQLLRDQNRSHDISPPDESSNDSVMADSAPRVDKTVPAERSSRARRRSYNYDDNFHKSVLFPSGDSPSVHDKVVDHKMLNNVPTRRQSHILYKGFMSGVHAISPVLHPPTVLKMYNDFWRWYDYSSHSGEPCPDPSFIPLLYAIWYGGSVTVSIRTIKSEFNVDSRSALSTTYSDEVTRWLSKISFPRSPSLRGLAAFLLVQTILSKEEEPLTSSLFISLALRVAQTMGLHRDPAQFGIASAEAETRRRVWWHIVHMDGVVAMSSGLPPLVSDENYWDVGETSEVKDTLLGTPEADQYERLVAANLRPRDNPDDPTVCGGPSMVNVYYLSARGKYIMARAVRRILKIQLGTRPVTRKDMEDLREILSELQLNLNSIINRIPEAQRPAMLNSDGSAVSPSLSSHSTPVEVRTSDTQLPADGPSGCPEQYHSPVLTAFHKWARILLSLFIDKAFCVAYQPFLKNAKSRIWPAARQGALRHCHGFMEKFILLATDPDFQPFQWSWPGNHQPMHATMIMLIDLYERPNSSEAPKSRAFIDKIFSISGPDGGVVGGEDGITTHRPLKDGGREAWDMMRRLREKAWQKAGLDPHQLWTEQAQIQAGVARDGNNTVMTDAPMTSNAQPVEPPIDNLRPVIVDRQLSDFSRRFFDMTRAHMLPKPTVSLQPPPRSSYKLPVPTPTSVPRTPQPASQQPPPPSIQQFSVPHAVLNPRLDSTLASSAVSPPESMTTTHPTGPLNQLANAPASSTTSFMDTTAITNPPLNMTMTTTGPSTPPSMMDPNLNFDWDQWDAVFGQHLPVADEFMELDPVAGFGFPDLGGGGGGDANGPISNQNPASGNGSDTGMMGAMGSWGNFG
ncbi:transcriptional regulator family: Fungal Specific TF [Paecilomyces variotii]|nr:transcriptional regulator family: Fungal Specific TF [Paecilomyces variotii]KAJ9285176.1 transcriptional regulator family: Fungal Specific TF [Paecilomyces variotii]KAJ9310215.1 transcriptional regulator family: Fungal Specific TF [Paecilomyces variotii]KAJ9322161.1 transcriptional regulator family: Fungal Specific TF [Paecilomyces variotii]KAJ9332070.1 transcriptional regulator family: Fungal Specific TF [Paecilomyces variotii]